MRLKCLVCCCRVHHRVQKPNLNLDPLWTLSSKYIKFLNYNQICIKFHKMYTLR